jgi:hypothetical protein
LRGGVGRLKLFCFSDGVYYVSDGVYILDEMCILREVGGVCGLDVILFLGGVYVLDGLYSLDVTYSLDGDLVLIVSYTLGEGSILGGAEVVFVLCGYVVGGVLCCLIDWLKGLF